MRPDEASFFDPQVGLGRLDRRLPHWDQPGTFAFITYRLADSVPAAACRQWRRDRNDLLRQAGLEPSDWHVARNARCKTLDSQVPGGRTRNSNTSEEEHAPATRAASLPRRDISVLKWKLFQAWDRHLDELLGSCHLRQSALSKIVTEGLLKFDGERYVMAALVVMPNHVHLLAAFQDERRMLDQGAAWRQYSARMINRVIGRVGPLWQQDQFDHLIRSQTSFDRVRRYIVENPHKANLRSGEYRIYVSADW